MEKGGLGIKDIRRFNHALLAKWKWSHGGGGIWPRYAERMQKKGGSNQLFNGKLAQEIRLFSLSLDQGNRVGEIGSWEGSEWRWRLRWRRERFVWETVQGEELYRLISAGSIKREDKDKQIWKGDAIGGFSVKSAYDCLGNIEEGQVKGILYHLWSTKAFPNVLTTAWRILLDKMPTRSGLSRRGVLVSHIGCEMCRAIEKTSQHLFFECAIAQRVWYLCFRWIGILGVQHKDLKVHFESFDLVHLNSKQNQLWKGMWVAIVNGIWEQKNTVIFKQGVLDAEEIFQMAQLRVKGSLMKKEGSMYLVNGRLLGDGWFMNVLQVFASLLDFPATKN
ncbi:uncharacterized protein [Phaseolus vulgaris]|uniref:uncharacterized protein n=1 Tax=Phaseolus vulgaris TaxID=3885 RepID=UPI0035C95635